MEPPHQQLAYDPTAGVEVHRPDDRFVPIRACDLVRALADDATQFGSDAAGLAQVAEALHAVIEQEAAAFERALCDSYARFNPDRDTVPIEDLKAIRTPQAYAELGRQLGYLFDKANFEKLTDAQIEAAINGKNSYGLSVRLDPDRVQEVSIWVRGRTTIERRRRSWRAPLRGEMLTVTVYRRLAIMVRLADNPFIILKLFKEIPIEDVQALLPHAEVQMSWFDRLLVLGGGAGTIGGTAVKLITSAGAALALGKLLWVLILGLGTLAFRTIMGYRRARNKCDSQRTRHLYYQNLTNNASLLHSLISMISQEELKEAVLVYAMCAAPPDRASSSRARLTERIHTYMKRRFEVEVDFDVGDALETITRLGLWSNPNELRVAQPGEAVERLSEHWRMRRTQRYHEQCVARVSNPCLHRLETGAPQG